MHQIYQMNFYSINLLILNYYLLYTLIITTGCLINDVIYNFTTIKNGLLKSHNILLSITIIVSEITSYQLG